MRPSWDDYFQQIAELVKTRSTCLRRQVGAVVVKDKRIVATGYNGAPARTAHCAEVGCMRERLGIPSGQRHELCRAIHAEQNAIIQAAQSGVSVDGATIYVTCQPCSLCAKILINAGIVRIVYKGDYPDELAVSMLEEAGVPFEKTGG
jgi:dCMP deaminase